MSQASISANSVNKTHSNERLTISARQIRMRLGYKNYGTTFICNGITGTFPTLMSFGQYLLRQGVLVLDEKKQFQVDDTALDRIIIKPS